MTSAAAPARIGGLLFRARLIGACLVGAACLGGCRGSLDLDRFRFDDPSITGELLSPDAGPGDPGAGAERPCVFGRARVGRCQLVAP